MPVTLQDRIEDVSAKMAENTKSRKAILGDGEAMLSTEDSEKVDKLEVDYTALGEEKDGFLKARQRLETLATHEKAEMSVTPSAGYAHTRVPEDGTLSQPNVLDAARDDPKCGFKTPREFLLSTMAAARYPGRTLDERLRPLIAPDRDDGKLAAGSDEQSTFSDPYGGFLLPEGFSPTLLSLDPEIDPIAGRTTVIPMDTQVVNFNARVDKNHSTSVTGGLRVYRRAEADTSSSSRMEIEQVKLDAQMLFGVAYATEEILARSPISFIAMLESGFGDEFAATMLEEKLNGSGVGMMEGVMNTPCKIDIAKETGQLAATIVKENIDKMRARCWRYGQAIWLYNHDCLPQLRSLVQTIGTGGESVSYFQTTPDGQSTLDGRPAFATEFTQTLGTSGDLLLGNWSQYLEGTLTTPQRAESIHVRFINHERTFKFWLENDGRCWWRSALTPRNSTDTLSPFLTLATRA